MAINLLNEAFRLNERMAGDLVTYNLTNWGNQTCLSLAVLSQLLGFIAHPCVQCLLSEKWSDTLQFTGAQFKRVRSSEKFNNLSMIENEKYRLHVSDWMNYMFLIGCIEDLLRVFSKKL